MNIQNKQLKRVYKAIENNLILWIMIFISSCGYSGEILSPMEKLHYSEKVTQRTLIIFLPGIGENAKKFAEKGFIQDIRDHGLPVDMIAVNSNIEYYLQDFCGGFCPERESDLVTHLKRDIITPMQKIGYRKIWLVGISLGGFGSLLYAQKHPQDIKGILILGPFLGLSNIADQISKVGGIKNWEPNPKDTPNFQYKMWKWLKNYQLKKHNLPTLYLGYGANDKFVQIIDSLAEILPQNQVITISGGHDWTTWKKLWKDALNRSIFTI